ncbi:gamma-glutamylcyclotransferase [Pseudomonas sp. CCC3.2]|uniref:gamma-glutamylcyclotransferase n=1 Tax=unclassified Pseudomonas TaxID=196821 RepID=UPI002AB3A0B9|nr:MULTISPECIES: gamma-glutamylcyclotransferase [unclassified Pseudomonas]MDY7562325.1 gamma-glutamylcyclotransferase [Pseudomonas sp. AB6]MEB0180807.1 gamma-glutamylcyclotransferase [Pseudomonas sp. CCC3.2]MEB0213128.1 gamma-glutamylcyclotransferase [Pseudomonas sp. AB6]
MGNELNSLIAAAHIGLEISYPPVIDLGPQLTREQLLSSMQDTMKLHQGGPVWLFAYGSLIWRPECSAVERQRGRVHGYHRGLYLWSHEHRGTPELPGLVFGLDRGGSCSGFAYRLPAECLQESLLALWQREMPYPSYRPHWLSCRLEDGTRVQALGFVLERHLPSYAGNLPDSVLSQVLANACGRNGSTRDYVEQTANCLRSHAMPDLNLEAKLKRMNSASQGSAG